LGVKKCRKYISSLPGPLTLTSRQSASRSACGGVRVMSAALRCCRVHSLRSTPPSIVIGSRGLSSVYKENKVHNKTPSNQPTTPLHGIDFNRYLSLTLGFLDGTSSSSHLWHWPPSIVAPSCALKFLIWQRKKKVVKITKFHLVCIYYMFIHNNEYKITF